MTDTMDTQTRKRHISHSSLETYLGCSWKWKLRYVDGLDSKPMLAGVGGTALHAASEVVDREQTWRES